MTTPAHSIAGGLIHGVIGWLIWRNPFFVGLVAGTGLVIGALPDLIGWFDRVLNKSNNWNVYVACHHDGWVNRYAKWIPAWGYHTYIDSLVHPYDENKESYLFVETLHWFVYLVILYAIE